MRYVGQKKRRALNLSSSQTLMAVGLELLMSCVRFLIFRSSWSPCMFAMRSSCPRLPCQQVGASGFGDKCWPQSREYLN